VDTVSFTYTIGKHWFPEAPFLIRILNSLFGGHSMTGSPFPMESLSLIADFLGFIPSRFYWAATCTDLFSALPSYCVVPGEVFRNALRYRRVNFKCFRKEGGLPLDRSDFEEIKGALGHSFGALVHYKFLLENRTDLEVASLGPRIIYNVFRTSVAQFDVELMTLLLENGRIGELDLDPEWLHRMFSKDDSESLQSLLISSKISGSDYKKWEMIYLAVKLHATKCLVLLEHHFSVNHLDGFGIFQVLVRSGYPEPLLWEVMETRFLNNDTFAPGLAEAFLLNNYEFCSKLCVFWDDRSSAGMKSMLDMAWNIILRDCQRRRVDPDVKSWKRLLERFPDVCGSESPRVLIDPYSKSYMINGLEVFPRLSGFPSVSDLELLRRYSGYDIPASALLRHAIDSGSLVDKVDILENVLKKQRPEEVEDLLLFANPRRNLWTGKIEFGFMGSVAEESINGPWDAAIPDCVEEEALNKIKKGISRYYEMPRSVPEDQSWLLPERFVDRFNLTSKTATDYDCEKIVAGGYVSCLNTLVSTNVISRESARRLTYLTNDPHTFDLLRVVAGETINYGELCRNAVLKSWTPIVKHLSLSKFAASSRVLLPLASSGEIVSFLLKQGIDINVRDPLTGMTCLFKACWEGNACLAVFLIQNGADMNVADIRGTMPIDVVDAAIDFNFEYGSFTVNSGEPFYDSKSHRFIRNILEEGSERTTNHGRNSPHWYWETYRICQLSESPEIGEVMILR
jgi:hypothetical protein